MQDRTDIVLDIFNPTQQEAIVGYMISVPSFFNKCLALIKPSYFSDTDLSSIVSCAFEVYEKNKIPPKQADVSIRMRLKYPDTHSKYDRKLDLCANSAKNIAFESICDSMETYLKACEFNLIFRKAAKQFQNRNYQSAFEIYTTGTKQIESISFGESGFRDVSKLADHLITLNSESKEKLTVGNPRFDALLNGYYDQIGADLVNQGYADFVKHKDNSEIPRGSLSKGNTTMVLGPTNSGKTSTVISIVVANLFFDKKVLFLTHEQSHKEIITKISEALHHKSTLELGDMLRSSDPNNSKVFETLCERQKKISKNLFYRDWIYGNKMFVEDVISFINSAQEEQISKTGKGFDLIVDDYPGKLMTRVGKKFSNEYAEQTYVYDQFVQLGLEHDCHVILPMQVNRQGSAILKENSAGKSDVYRYVTEADVAGAYNIMQRADNIITINSSPTDKKYGVIRYFIAKSRSARTHKVFAVKADLGRSVTHKWNSASFVFDEADAVSNSYMDLYPNLGINDYEPNRGTSKKKANLNEVVGDLYNNHNKEQQDESGRSGAAELHGDQPKP